MEKNDTTGIAPLSKLYRRLRSFKVLLLFFSLFILFNLAFYLIAQSANIDNLDIIRLQLAFTKENVINLVNRWGSIGRNAVLHALYLDFIYPLIYVGLLCSSLAFFGPTWEKLDRVARIIFSLPVIAAGLDYIENLIQLIILHDPYKVPSMFILIMSTVASMKWLLIAISLSQLIYFVATYIKVNKAPKVTY